MPKAKVKVLLTLNSYTVQEDGSAHELIGRSTLAENIQVEIPSIEDQTMAVQMGALRLATEDAVRQKLEELRWVDPLEEEDEEEDEKPAEE